MVLLGKETEVDIGIQMKCGIQIAANSTNISQRLSSESRGVCFLAAILLKIHQVRHWLHLLGLVTTQGVQFATATDTNRSPLEMSYPLRACERLDS